MTESSTSVPPSYSVGRGKPPLASQWKKGQSGNPRGRKASPPVTDLRELLDDVLAEPVRVNQGSRSRNVSTLEALLLKHANAALKGNCKSAKLFFKLAIKYGMLGPERVQSFVKIMEPGGEDGKIIRMYHTGRDGRHEEKRSLL